MLLRIVDLRERFGRSDDATASPSRDRAGAVGNCVDEPALEGELGAPEVFCFDVVCPMSIQISVVRCLSGCVRKVVVTGQEGRGVK